MAMPSTNYPLITIFEIAEIHTDGRKIVLRNRDKETVLSIALLSCYGLQAKPYIHEPRSLEPQEETDLPSSEKAKSSAVDDEIPF